MILLALFLAGSVTAATQAPPQQRPPDQPAPPRPTINCVGALVGGSDVAVRSFCQGEQERRLAETAPEDDPKREPHLKTAADYYRKAITVASDEETKTQALEMLARIYDAQHLDEPEQEELVLRELVALTPADLGPLFRLAKLQEDRGLIDAAETTLLAARHQHPDLIEPYQELARFYARRATALQQAKQKEAEPDRPPGPGQPDEQGVYRIGGPIPAPRRIDATAPQYPPGAQAARLEGVVIAEITVDETGQVANARVLRSIPLLDEAALAAVRQWRYEPTLVDGRPVPVKMTVTVNFTQKRE